MLAVRAATRISTPLATRVSFSTPLATRVTFSRATPRGALAAGARAPLSYAPPRDDDDAAAAASRERAMSLDGLLVALVERSSGSVKGATSIGAAVGLHAVAAYAVLCAPAPGALELALCAASYSARMFGITAGFHRYFAHRSFECGRGTQLMLGVLGAAAWQRGPLWWAAHHHEHHAHSDTPADPHSPVSGSIVWAHLGWMATPRRAPLSLIHI